jgi:hypothetical protein
MAERDRAQKVALAKNDIRMALIGLQKEHDLTDVEMLQAVTDWQRARLGCMLMDERSAADLDHPADPGT